MFAELKNFFCQLCTLESTADHGTGCNVFMHRARVAREQEDIEAFRLLREELVGIWHRYAEVGKIKNCDMEARLERLYAVDEYLSDDWADRNASTYRRNSHGEFSSQIGLDDDAIDKEGILFNGNMRANQYQAELRLLEHMSARRMQQARAEQAACSQRATQGVFN